MSYELTIERICRCSCCRTRETFSSRSTAAVASARPAGSAAWCLKPLTKADFELAVAISKVRTRDDNPVQPIKMLSVTVRNLKTARADEAATDEAESPTKKQKSPA